MLDQLEKLGLNKNEARVYLAALELGESSVQRIAKKAAIKRTTASSVVASLREKGLIIKTQTKKRPLYYAESPKKLLQNAKNQLDTANELFPQLLAIANLIDKKPKVRFYSGPEEFKDLYNDILNYPGKPYISWISHGVIEGYGYPFWFTEFRPKRIDNKIYLRAIVTDSEITQKMRKDDKESFRETRIDTSSNLDLQSDIILYGDKVLGFVSFKDMIGFTVESKKIYDTVLSIYEIHWSLLKR